jgi:hypothetical protein
VVCLLLFGMVAQASLGPIRRQTDGLLLRGAREELVAVLHRARMEARIHGESTVRLREGADVEYVPRSGGAVLRVPLTDRGVELEIVGVRTSVDLAFGPLGVAQFAPATVVLRRRGSEARLVVSGYGRIRREAR